MDYYKFKQSVLEEIDCFTNDYQDLKTILEEVLIDIDKEIEDMK